MMSLLKTLIDSNGSLLKGASRESGLDPDDYSRVKPRDRKKTWGIFYTPVEVSRCLADWAIKAKDDVVLEPSFGGCGFLKEAARALQEKGCRNAWDQLCGCDKDMAAFVYLPQPYSDRKHDRRFLHSNFLETHPSDYVHDQFDVVIGNPPYVSRHNMRKYQLESAERINRGSSYAIPRKASLWAYFLVHSLSFLKRDGRMAWVLPRSLSQSDYGRRIVEYLCERFQMVTVISVGHRLFLNSGAEELIDVLLCAGHHCEARLRVNPRITYANSVDDLIENIKCADVERCALRVDISSGRQELLTQAERHAIEQYGKVVSPRSLEEIAKIHIGIVTGATNFFVLRHSDLKLAGFTQQACTPLLTKSAYARGLVWQKEDVESSIAADHRMLLVRHDLETTRKYWAKFPTELRDSIATFKKRSIWNAPDDCKVPPAFFFGLVDNGPRIVINSAGINANNSIYRVYLDPQWSSAQLKTLALLMMSSYVQASGELVGRVCGSGGLKFEISDAYRLKVICSAVGITQRRVDELWPKVDLLIRNGNEADAIGAIDDAIREGSQGALTAATVTTVQGALKKLRIARKRGKRF